MDRATILEKIIEAVCENLEVDEADVTEETSFEDLGADSFDMLELVTALEDEFSMTFADDAVGSIATIGQVVDAIASAQ